MEIGFKQISFKKMNCDEFKVYSSWSVKAYADHLIKSGDERFRFKALRAEKSAFVKIQEDAKEKGFSKMVLNVFKHTPVSYTMYEKNGFKVIEDHGGSAIMEKNL